MHAVALERAEAPDLCLEAAELARRTPLARGVRDCAKQCRIAALSHAAALASDKQPVRERVRVCAADEAALRERAEQVDEVRGREKHRGKSGSRRCCDWGGRRGAPLDERPDGLRVLLLQLRRRCLGAAAASAKQCGEMPGCAGEGDAVVQTHSNPSAPPHPPLT